MHPTTRRAAERDRGWPQPSGRNLSPAAALSSLWTKPAQRDYRTASVGKDLQDHRSSSNPKPTTSAGPQQSSGVFRIYLRSWWRTRFLQAKKGAEPGGLQQAGSLLTFLGARIPHQAGLELFLKAHPTLPRFSARRGSCFLSPGGVFSPQNVNTEEAFDLWAELAKGYESLS